MRELIIERITPSVTDIAIEEAAKILDGFTNHPLSFVPWKAFPYQPKVSFAIGYTPTAIFIKYFVEEKELRANASKMQEAVWEDSCVEFFIAFDNDTDAYYNFEFNCLGTCYAAFGKSRKDRKLLASEVVQKIRSRSVIRRGESNTIFWELTVSVPVIAFVHSAVTDLRGTIVRANFYKCGDLLTEPHFIAWSNIESASPNFHLPAFFGKLNFG